MGRRRQKVAGPVQNLSDFRSVPDVMQPKDKVEMNGLGRIDGAEDLEKIRYIDTVGLAAFSAGERER